MSEKRMDLLSLYAGLDITYPATDQRASLYQAISSFFKKTENALSFLQSQGNRNHTQTPKFKK
jgi:oligoendopeptidase F